MPGRGSSSSIRRSCFFGHAAWPASANGNGTIYLFRLAKIPATVTATDGTHSGSVTYNWTISRLTLSNPGNQANREGDSVSLTVAAADSEGDTVAYSATGLPTGVSINSSTGAITGTIGSTAHGSSPYQVTITATAGTHSASQQLVWTVTPAVALANPGPQTSATGDTVSLAVSATSIVGGTLNYSASGLPTGLSINSSTGSITGTVSSMATSGTATVTATAGMHSNSQSFPWTVAPIALPVPGDQTNFDGDSVSLSLAAHYHGLGTVTYSATGLPAGLSINSSTGLISGTIGSTADVDGPYAVTITATDGTVTATQALTWNVNPVVTLDSVDDQANGAGDVVSLAMSADDALNNTLSYSATGLPPGLSINSTTGVISGTVAAGAASNTPYSVTVTASDGALSASQTFNWTVAPVWLVNPGPQTNVDDQAVALALTAVDAASDTLTFTATDLPPGLSINSSTGEITGTLTSTADEDSGYLTSVSASDGTNSASQTIDWTIEQIAPNNPGTQTAQEGGTVSLATGSVGIGTAVFSASGLPAGLSINSSTGAITGTIAAGANGAFPVTITATNGTVASSQTFTLNVNPVVAVAAIADQTNNEGDSVSLTPSGTDSNSATLTWSATGLPAGLSINSATGAITGTVTDGDAAAGPAYSVTVTASDGTYSNSETFTWNIANPSDSAPTLTNPGPQANQAGDSVDFFLAASDTAGDPMTYSADNLPDGLTLNAGTGEISGTIADDVVSSVPYSVAATADNGQGETASQSFSWYIGAATISASWNASITATEGVDTSTLTLATFTTPDMNAQDGDFAATVNWGDGNSSPATVSGSDGTFTVTADHAFTQTGSKTVAVAISSTSGATTGATVSGTASIGDGSMTLTGGATLGAVVGKQQLFVLGSLADTNLDSSPANFTVSVYWGDSMTPTAVTLTPAVNGQYLISAAHTYTATGNFTVAIDVTDAYGATTSTTSGVAVGNALTGESATITLGTFTNGNPDATASDFSATVNWGDGSSSAGTITQSGSTFTVSGTHVYTSTSTGSGYSVGVTITDSDGNTLGSTTTVIVVNQGSGSGSGSLQPPVADDASLAVEENDPASIDLADYVTDPNGYSTFISIVQWPSHGTLTYNSSTGMYVYTPATGYLGSDSFTFQATDGVLTSNVATVSITVASSMSPSLEIDIWNTPTHDDDIYLVNTLVPVTITLSDPVSGIHDVELSTTGPTTTLSQSSFSLSDGESATLYLTQTQVSAAIDDMDLIGMVDGQEAGQQQGTGINITIPNITDPDTPKGMPDRIPPRQVQIFYGDYQGPDISSKNVYVAINGWNVPGNGNPVWAGNSEFIASPHWLQIKSSGWFNMWMRGSTAPGDGTQTAPANGPKLYLSVVQYDPATNTSKVLKDAAGSNIWTDYFAISAIPVATEASNVQKIDDSVVGFKNGVPTATWKFGAAWTITFKSDSWNPADLDQDSFSEIVSPDQLRPATGSLKTSTLNVQTKFAACKPTPDTNATRLGMSPIPIVPLPSVPFTIVKASGPGYAADLQYFVFFDKRTGGSEQKSAAHFLIKNSGYLIEQSLIKSGADFVENVVRTPTYYFMNGYNVGTGLISGKRQWKLLIQPTGVVDA